MSVIDNILKEVFEDPNSKKEGVIVQLFIKGSAQPLQGALRAHSEIEGALELLTPAVMADPTTGGQKRAMLHLVFPPESITALARFEAIDESKIVTPRNSGKIIT